MKVHQRIVGNAINFDDAELDIYSGCGWNLAHFEDGKLVKLYPLDSYEDTDVAWELASEFVHERPDDTWLGMCSSCQFVFPTRIDLRDNICRAQLRMKIRDATSEL